MTTEELNQQLHSESIIQERAAIVKITGAKFEKGVDAWWFSTEELRVSGNTPYEALEAFTNAFYKKKIR